MNSHIKIIIFLKNLKSNGMKRKYVLISLSFMVVNFLVLTTFFGSELIAGSAKPESSECDCSAFPQPLGYGCIPYHDWVWCFYPEGPFGYPQWIWEPYMECVVGELEEYCNCDWEFNECEESN